MLHLIGSIIIMILAVEAFFLIANNLGTVVGAIWSVVKPVIYYGCIPVTLLILFGLAYSPDTKSTDKWDQVVNTPPVTHVVKMQPVTPVTPVTKVDLYAEFEDAPAEPVAKVDPYAEFGPDVTPDKQK